MHQSLCPLIIIILLIIELLVVGVCGTNIETSHDLYECQLLYKLYSTLLRIVSIIYYMYDE